MDRNESLYFFSQVNGKLLLLHTKSVAIAKDYLVFVQYRRESTFLCISKDTKSNKGNGAWKKQVYVNDRKSQFTNSNNILHNITNPYKFSFSVTRFAERLMRKKKRNISILSVSSCIRSFNLKRQVTSAYLLL